VYKVTDDIVVTIKGGVTLRMDIADFSTAIAPDLTNVVGFTVLSSKTSELYYSNQWMFASPSITVTQTLKTGLVNIN